MSLAANDTSSTRDGQTGAPRPLARSTWEALLDFLGPEPRTAASAYEAIRGDLVQHFARRRASAPEDLADWTMDRVARKLEEGAEIPREKARAYCFAVAHRIFFESLRGDARRRKTIDRLQHASDLEPTAAEGERDAAHLEALEACLTQLSAEDRALLIEYHRGEGRERIERRRQLAEARGLALNALRVRMHRLHAQVQRLLSKGARPDAPARAPAVRASRTAPYAASARTGREPPQPRRGRPRKARPHSSVPNVPAQEPKFPVFA